MVGDTNVQHPNTAAWAPVIVVVIGLAVISSSYLWQSEGAVLAPEVSSRKINSSSSTISLEGIGRVMSAGINMVEMTTMAASTTTITSSTNPIVDPESELQRDDFHEAL